MRAKRKLLLEGKGARTHLGYIVSLKIYEKIFKELTKDLLSPHHICAALFV